MNREAFWDELSRNGISSTIVALEPDIKDGYCIRKNRSCWEVFVQERGVAYDVIGFPSESNALQYLLELLIDIYGKQS